MGWMGGGRRFRIEKGEGVRGGLGLCVETTSGKKGAVESRGSKQMRISVILQSAFVNQSRAHLGRYGVPCLAHFPSSKATRNVPRPEKRAYMSRSQLRQILLRKSAVVALRIAQAHYP